MPHTGFQGASLSIFLGLANLFDCSCLLQQAKNCQTTRSTNENLAIRDSGNIEVIVTLQVIAARILSAVIKFVSQVGSIVGMQHGTVLLIEQPDNPGTWHTAIAGGDWYASWIVQRFRCLRNGGWFQFVVLKPPGFKMIFTTSGIDIRTSGGSPVTH